jgi:two-component system response regulator HydG
MRQPEDKPRFRSKAYLEALNRLERFARAGAVTMLLEGESGTGKSRHAEYVHIISQRQGPYECAILSAISDSFAHSDLFGHVSGAFTDARRPRQGLFVSAVGGTLFLDEIGKASPYLQQLLLHAVEDKQIRPLGSDRMVQVDVRLVVATNIPLHQLVEEQRFLPDLHARIGNFRVELPPLRDRRADIPVLVDLFLEKRASELGYPKPTVHPGLMDALQGAPWPNNLRELDTTVQRLLIDAAGARELTPDLCVGDLDHLRKRQKHKPGSLHLADVENAIAAAGSVSKAAERLGIDRTTVYRIREREGRPELQYLA